VVLNRSVGRARALVSDLRVRLCGGTPPSPEATLQAAPLTQETLIEGARAADVLVNATPVGMWPHTDHSIWPESAPMGSQLAVFDLVYNPRETKLLRQARRWGARGVEGLGMLVRQGALSFSMWTGEEAPLQVMHSACERSLRS
jgi:shikimate dehydrogenase